MHLYAHYEHSITDEYAFKQRHIQRVPYGKTVGFWLQPGVLNITGNFLVATTDKVYSIKNFSFDIPLSGEYRPLAGGKPIPQTNVQGLAFDAECGKPQGRVPILTGAPPPNDAVGTPIDG